MFLIKIKFRPTLTEWRRCWWVHILKDGRLGAMSGPYTYNQARGVRTLNQQAYEPE